MVNFIAVDDFAHILTMIEENINKAMISNNIEYQIHSFFDYDKNFLEIMNKKIPNKVYILDIETKSASGIDIARKIRANDVDSVIIFVTAHSYLGSLILQDQLMFLAFICKYDSFDIKLQKAVNKSLDLLSQKTIIRFKDYNTLYMIPIKDIIYIERDTCERKCFIKTEYATYKVGKTLLELKKLAPNCLKQSHRACLVNMDRVRKINKIDNKIEFDTGEKIYLLSDNYRRELIGC